MVEIKVGPSQFNTIDIITALVVIVSAIIIILLDYFYMYAPLSRIDKKVESTVNKVENIDTQGESIVRNVCSVSDYPVTVCLFDTSVPSCIINPALGSKTCKNSMVEAGPPPSSRDCITLSNVSTTSSSSRRIFPPCS